MRIAWLCAENNDTKRERGCFLPDNLVRWKKTACTNENSTTCSKEMAGEKLVLKAKNVLVLDKNAAF